MSDQDQARPSSSSRSSKEGLKIAISNLNCTGVSEAFDSWEVGVMAGSTSKRYPPELRERAVSRPWSISRSTKTWWWDTRQR